jgi:hypothetical protein
MPILERLLRLGELGSSSPCLHFDVQLQIDMVDLFWSAAEALMERLENLNVSQAL